MGIIKKDKSPLEKEIGDLDVKLSTLDPLTEGAEYEQLLSIRKDLAEQLSAGCWKAKIDPNMVLRVLATFGVAGLVMIFEMTGHIFTSKGTSFMPKIL